MKNIIKEMNKAFDSRVRIGIMALLSSNQWLDFKELKQKLGVTDGNLASHTASLERRKYIKVRKRFVKKRPNTSYYITEEGRIAFTKYVNALKQLLSIHTAIKRKASEMPVVEPEIEEDKMPITDITKTEEE